MRAAAGQKDMAVVLQAEGIQRQPGSCHGGHSFLGLEDFCDFDFGVIILGAGRVLLFFSLRYHDTQRTKGIVSELWKGVWAGQFDNMARSCMNLNE